MRNDAKKSAQLDRRRFLSGAGLAIGAAGATAAASGTVAAPVEPAPTEQHAGYRETEHVRTYYESTR